MSYPTNPTFHWGPRGKLTNPSTPATFSMIPAPIPVQQSYQVDQEKSPLSERAILVRFERQNVWLAQRKDNRLAKEVADKYGATIDLGKYTRSLFPMCADPLQEVINAVNNCYEVWRSQTLPWLPGVNILSTALFQQFTTNMSTAIRRLDQSREKLIEVYPQMVSQGLINSKGLSTASDYPTVEEIRSYYNVKLSYYPVPSTRDWRVTLPPDVVDDIRQALDTENERRLADTTVELWTRVVNEVEAAWKNLDGKKLRPEWIDRLRSFAEAIPDLNLTDDPNLNDVAAKAKDLTNYDAETLRANPELRKELAEQSKALYDQLKEMY